jgi:serine/threonine-protein kinase RsbW
MALPAPEVQLSIGSRFENIELVKVVLDDCMRRLNADDDVRHWMEMAMREAVANAIKHGNKQDPTKRVTVELGIEGREIVLRVMDEGEGFDPGLIQDPLQPENRFKRDGRGIFYMRRFMDEVDYSFRPGGGTVVTMRKRLGKPATGSDDLQEENS